MSQNLDSTLETYISWQLEQFKDKFFPNCDVIAYYGGIFPWSKEVYQPKLEAIGEMANSRTNKFLVIILNTNGGSVESVEKMVEITRHFYKRYILSFQTWLCRQVQYGACLEIKFTWTMLLH
ncbi:TPA: hypothetical protein ACX7ZB_005256 [Escherichia coli]